MLLQGQIGPSTGADGNFPNVRQGKTGDIIVSELNGRYYEQTSRQNVFFGATPSGQTTSAGLTTTYVGLCLSNPLGNTKNIAVLKVNFAWTVISAAVNFIGLGVGYSSTTNVVHGTPVTGLGSALVGTGATPTGKLDTASTLSVAPVYHSFLSSNPTATTNPTTNTYDLEGSIVLPPGGYVCTLTAAASSAAAFWAGISWMEITP